jgi:hypothetical protein
MAYERTNRAGRTQVTAGTTGAGTAASMPNHGTSIIANSSGENYVLAPPVAGCRKRVIFSHLSTANLCVLRASTTGSDAITFVGATTGINVITLNTARVVTTPIVIDLEGFNSTSWVITSVFPETSLLSVTLSSA